MYNLTARMQERYNENKQSTKTYATVEAADKAARKAIADVAASYEKPDNMMYLTVYLPEAQRYAVAIDFGNWMRMHGVGGYVGVFNNMGFWSF